jgi:hypothetical protein
MVHVVMVIFSPFGSATDYLEKAIEDLLRLSLIPIFNCFSANLSIIFQETLAEVSCCYNSKPHNESGSCHLQFIVGIITTETIAFENGKLHVINPAFSNN